MALPTLQEIQAIRDGKDGRKSVLASLRLAKAHTEDIRLHTEVNVSEGSSNPAYHRFLKRVEGYLEPRKFRVFKKYHRFPMATNAVCSDILQQLNKVFEGKNPVRELSFSSDRAEVDFLEFLKESQFSKTWRAKSSRALATGVNSVLIVDAPKESPEGLPKPYFYFLPIEGVEDLEVDSSGNLVWVQFFQADFQLVHISREGWQILKTQAARGGDVVSIEHETPNRTGRDLCRFWWENDLSDKDAVLKLSPFSEWVSKLDWLEIWSTWKTMLDAFASNPVTWSIEEDCTFQDKERGVYCEGGYLKRRGGEFVRGMDSDIHSGYQPCPNCGDRRFVGPGSHFEIPPPKQGEDMRSPFGVVGIDKASLDNAREEEQRKRDEITKGITGGGSEPVNREAINVTQVSALFEGWTGVLRQLKKSFESSEAWVLETMAAIRYGGDVLKASLNYGTEFYLLSEQEALAFYTAAREVGLPDYVLDFLLSEYYKTKFKNDPQSLERVRLLMNVEPLKHVTKQKALELAEKNLVPVEEVRLKIEFGSLVQRFERENGPVSEFGVVMDGEKKGGNFAVRVERVREVLLSYLSEIQSPASVVA